jgi:hypothetical protein
MRIMRAGSAGLRTVGAAVAALLLLLLVLSPVVLRGERPSLFVLLVIAVAVLGAGLTLRWRGSAGTRTLGSILIGGVSLAIVIGLIAALNLLFGGPPRPDRSLVPEVVGVVVRWDFIEGECQMTRLALQSGQTLDLRLLGDSRARCGDGPWQTGVPELTRSHDFSGTAQAGEAIPDGGLLYYGHDGEAEWIAGASSNRLAAESAECPYTLSGAGYDEGATLHLSTGLVVKKTSNFENKTPWMKETSTFRDSDTICINQRGEAISISRVSPI